MSTRFTIWCEIHEVGGPHIRRHHEGAVLHAADVPRLFPTNDPDQASDDWGGFLIEHEFCQLRLVREMYPGKMEIVERPKADPWIELGLLEGWTSGAWPLKVRTRNDALDWSGRVVLTAESPTEDDLLRPIAKLPDSLGRFFGTKSTLATSVRMAEGDRAVLPLIDAEGYLRYELA